MAVRYSIFACESCLINKDWELSCKNTNLAGCSSFSDRERKGLRSKNKIRSKPRDRVIYKKSVKGLLSSKVFLKYNTAAKSSAIPIIKAILQYGYDISMIFKYLCDL